MIKHAERKLWKKERALALIIIAQKKIIYRKIKRFLLKIYLVDMKKSADVSYLWIVSHVLRKSLQGNNISNVSRSDFYSEEVLTADQIN